MTCPLPHRFDPTRRRALAEGRAVCAGHDRRVADALDELPSMHAELVSRHVVGGRGYAVKLSGHPERGIPYSDAVGDERDLIRAQLASWAELVVTTRELAERPAASDLDANAALLRVHRGWLLTGEWAEDFATEMLARHARGFSLLYPSGRRRFEVTLPSGRPALCTEVIDGVQCRGVLYAVIRDTDELLPSALTCDECGLDLPAHAWLTYARTIGRGTP